MDKSICVYLVRLPFPRNSNFPVYDMSLFNVGLVTLNTVHASLFLDYILNKTIK